VLQRGDVSDADFQSLRRAGFNDVLVTEIIAAITLNIFTNYFNSVARTEVDFPLLKPGADSPHDGSLELSSDRRDQVRWGPIAELGTLELALAMAVRGACYRRWRRSVADEDRRRAELDPKRIRDWQRLIFRVSSSPQWLWMKPIH